MKKRKNKKIYQRKGFIISSGIALGLILLLSLLAYMILWTGEDIRWRKNDPTQMLNKVFIDTKETQSIELTDADINGIIDSFVKKGLNRGGITILDGYANFDDSTITMSFKAKLKGIMLLLSTSGTLETNNTEIFFKPSSFKVGKLPLPKVFIMKRLKVLDRDGITISKEKIAIKKNVLPLKVSKLQIKNEKLLLDLEKTSIFEEASEKNQSKTSKESVPSKKALQSSQQQDEKRKMLRKVAKELTGVSEAVKSNKEKEIVTEVIAVVNKMIADPSYDYKASMNSVKGNYEKLSNAQKENFKSAVFANMNINEALKVLYLFKAK